LRGREERELRFGSGSKFHAEEVFNKRSEGGAAAAKTQHKRKTGLLVTIKKKNCDSWSLMGRLRIVEGGGQPGAWRGEHPTVKVRVRERRREANEGGRLAPSAL